MSNIVKVRDETELNQRLEPTVISKADPRSDWLLEARADLNREDRLRRILLEGKRQDIPNEELADHLGVQLNNGWGGGFAQEAYDAALYLIDEYDQLGEGVHLVSTETGRVIITLTEQDLWDPGEVPREGGGMVQALKRIRPDLEAAIVVWTFDRSREQRIVATLAAKGHQTALLKEEGDPRLLVATREGRKQIVQALTNYSPVDLLDLCGGTSGTFLRHFDIQAEKLTKGTPVLEGTLSSTSSMSIMDQTTVNLHHNRASTLRGALIQGWVRDLARQLSAAARDRFNIPSESLESLTAASTKNWTANFWVVPPEVVTHLNNIRPDWTLMPVDHAHVMGFTLPKVGTLVVPEQFGIETDELFEKWSTRAHLEFKLYVDWGAICYKAITGLVYQAHVKRK